MICDPKESAHRPGAYANGYSDDELVLDGRTALMTRKALMRLEVEAGHYDSSYPTGVYAGKLWLREDRGGLWLCAYEWHPPLAEGAFFTRHFEVVVA